MREGLSITKCIYNEITKFLHTPKLKINKLRIKFFGYILLSMSTNDLKFSSGNYFFHLFRRGEFSQVKPPMVRLKNVLKKKYAWRFGF